MLVQIFGDIRRPLVHCIAPTHAQQGLWLIVFAVAPAVVPSHPSWIERKAGSALAFACNGLCNRRTHTDGVVRPWANLRGFVTLLVCRRSGPLSSAGITQLPRSYGPIRHLSQPALALAGSPLTSRLPTLVAKTDFPCCALMFCHTCCHLYPGETVRGVSRSLA